jgi:hypothetical protein
MAGVIWPLSDDNRADVTVVVLPVVAMRRTFRLRGSPKPAPGCVVRGRSPVRGRRESPSGLR